MENLNKITGFWTIFIICVCLLSIIPLSRCISGECNLIEQDVYETLVHSRQSTGGESTFMDVYHPSSRNIVVNPHVWLVGIVYRLLNAPGLFIFSIVLATSSIFLFYRLLGTHLKNRYLVFIICLLAISSPPFIYTFMTLGKLSSLFFLTLLSIYISGLSSWKYRVANILLLGIVSMYGVTQAIFAGLIIFTYATVIRKTTSFFATFLTASIIVLILYQFGYPLHFSPINQISDDAERLVLFVSNLGGLSGFSVVGLILCFIGLGFSWNQKKKYYTAYLVFILGLVVSFLYTPDFNVFLTFGVAIYGGIALYRLILMNWNLKVIKNSTIFVIILSLIFVGISEIHELSNATPKTRLIKSLEWLGTQGNMTERVLTQPSISAYVKYYANKGVLIDQLSFNYYDEEQYINLSDRLFQSRNLKYVTSTSSKYNITYVLITDEMKNGLIWNQPDEGIQFLFNNKDFFELVYNSDNIEIWKILT